MRIKPTKAKKLNRRARPTIVEDNGTWYVRSDNSIVVRDPYVGFYWNGKQV